MSELRPCRKCGHKAEVVSRDDGFFIMCGRVNSNCTSSSTGVYEHLEDAKEAWNDINSKKYTGEDVDLE